MNADPAEVERFLERYAEADLAKEAGEEARKIDRVASSLSKAPLDRSDGLVAAMAERK